jgi:hypothetical protein
MGMAEWPLVLVPSGGVFGPFRPSSPARLPHLVSFVMLVLSLIRA